MKTAIEQNKYAAFTGGKRLNMAYMKVERPRSKGERCKIGTPIQNVSDRKHLAHVNAYRKTETSVNMFNT